MIDELERDAGAALEVRGAVQLLVHGVAVDEQEDVVAEVGGQEHAARADVDRVQRVLVTMPSARKLIASSSERMP